MVCRLHASKVIWIHNGIDFATFGDSDSCHWQLQTISTVCAEMVRKQFQQAGEGEWLSAFGKEIKRLLNRGVSSEELLGTIFQSTRVPVAHTSPNPFSYGEETWEKKQQERESEGEEEWMASCSALLSSTSCTSHLIPSRPLVSIANKRVSCSHSCWITSRQRGLTPCTWSWRLCTLQGWTPCICFKSGHEPPNLQLWSGGLRASNMKVKKKKMKKSDFLLLSSYHPSVTLNIPASNFILD